MGGIIFFACTSHVSMYLHPGIVGWLFGYLKMMKMGASQNYLFIRVLIYTRINLFILRHFFACVLTLILECSWLEPLRFL
jgi:hypothetical protein